MNKALATDWMGLNTAVSLHKLIMTKKTSKKKQQTNVVIPKHHLLQYSTDSVPQGMYLNS